MTNATEACVHDTAEVKCPRCKRAVAVCSSMAIWMTAALDHDSHRVALQARNTELVEENRRLRAELTAQRERGDALLADYWAVVDASRAAKARVCEACGLPTEWTMTKAGYRRCECPSATGGTP